MNGRLRMDDYIHFRRGHVKKSACLDDLEPLVHQCGGIDSDALAHLPRGMIQRLLYRDGCKFRRWSIAEWPAGSRKPNAGDFVHTSTAHALVHRVVLAVDGEKRDIALPRFGGDQFSRCDEAFLVREAERLAGANSLVRGFEPGDSDDGTDDKIDFRVSRDSDGAGCAVNDFDLCEARVLQPGAQGIRVSFGSHRHDTRLPALRLL